MDCLRIEGRRPLAGSVAVSGAKNGALPIMAASLLAEAPIFLRNVPKLTDVDTLALVLERLGMSVNRTADDRLRLETLDDSPYRAPTRYVHRMRAAFCVLGPLLARRGRAVVALPGGCKIGSRPVDLHLKGLAALGADIRVQGDRVIGKARRLRGATIDLAGPRGPTVTGTANVLSAAVMAQGRTTIQGAACEPEIVDLGRFLIAMGADITGLGTQTIQVVGQRRLGGASHRVIPDRIEAATLLLAPALAGGWVRIEGVIPQHLRASLDCMHAAGIELSVDESSVLAKAPDRLRPLEIAARPYPDLPTDLQAQFTALAAMAQGASRVRDYVFPGRTAHLCELGRMGAWISRTGRSIRVDGASELQGVAVRASDLRASAALVLAGLAAWGTTIVTHAHHLDRGYERLDEKLNALGARIERAKSTQPVRLAGS